MAIKVTWSNLSKAPRQAIVDLDDGLEPISVHQSAAQQRDKQFPDGAGYFPDKTDDEWAIAWAQSIKNRLDQEKTASEELNTITVECEDGSIL